MTKETSLEVSNLIWPCFVVEGQGVKTEISSMPGVFRHSLDLLVEEVGEAHKLGLPAIALFPALPDSKKDAKASESKNPSGLTQRCIQELKSRFPDLLVISDVAMDPYSSDGHDGLVKNGKILNDESLPILAEMALAQAKAGADIVAPSDMMDGRVGYIRKALDESGFQDVSILAYTAKYASGFYGPFREALDSAPRFGDKKTYQMDPANRREALRELRLDVSEGADIVMVKPALSYLDIISDLKQHSDVPVAAYSVSGEYAMIKAGAKAGFFNERALVEETHVSIKRAGADIILSYYAKDIARWLREAK